MTDKQIIIDGVDVSGCSEIRLKQDGLHTCWEYKELDGISICKDKPNCLYKQLKRKEQECERLRFPMPDTNYAILTKEEFEQLDQLKADNEELTSKCSQLEKNFKETADGLLKIQYALADYCNKYSKTLTEIKEIAQYDVYTPHTDLCLKLNWVKKKISEVENDRT